MSTGPRRTTRLPGYDSAPALLAVTTTAAGAVRAATSQRSQDSDIPGPVVGSICTGFGGLDLGVLGGGRIAWCADTDPHIAERTPGLPNLGDVRAIDWTAVEVLTAGSAVRTFPPPGGAWPLARRTRPRRSALFTERSIAMPSNATAQDESGDGVPRWVATARRESRARRLVTRTSRLFRAPSRTRPDTYPSTDRGRESSLSRRVLRDYHATNLAKARAGSEDLVRAGFNTGNVPYGYRAHRVRITPPGRRPRWRTRLVIEPVEAATVRMIFVWRGEDRVPVREMRWRLAAARYPAPLDPETGLPGAWTVPIIRAVLRNPKYLGHQVWGRRHHGRRTHPDRWVWSPKWAHPPIVSAELFAAANPRLRTSAR